ncbi:MAG: DUF3788 domain-containing protein [Bacillota bacterium]
MNERDLVLDAGCTPSYEEILHYIEEPGRGLWQDINSFIQQQYKASPKIMYSKCSAKPGWNVKYQKSGKSICTLYPEKEGFVALVVILLGMVPIIKAMSEEFEPEILEIINTAKPFNGTLWLMIDVKKDVVGNNVKQLLALKHETQRRITG